MASLFFQIKATLLSGLSLLVECPRLGHNAQVGKGRPGISSYPRC